MNKLFEKLRDGEFVKGAISKLICLIIMFAAAILLLNVLSGKTDGRRQIVSEGRSETDSFDSSIYKSDEEIKLENILSGIVGVGDVEVMINCSSEETNSLFEKSELTESEKAQGIIVLSSEAENPVIVTRIKEAVSTVYKIDMSDIAVFELEK